MQRSGTGAGGHCTRGLGAGAGHCELQLPLCGWGAQRHPQVGGLQPGLHGIDQQAFQSHRAAIFLRLPLPLGLQGIDAQRRGAWRSRRCGFAGLDVGRESHAAVALGLRYHATRERRCRQRRVQRLGGQVAQLGLSVDGARGGRVVALQRGRAFAHAGRSVGNAPARAIPVGAGGKGGERQARLVPWACQLVVDLCLHGPARSALVRGGAGLQRAVQPRGGRLGPQRGQVDGAQRGAGLLHRLRRPRGQRGLQSGLHGFGYGGGGGGGWGALPGRRSHAGGLGRGGGGLRSLGKGAQLGIQLQLRGSGGQGAFECGVGLHLHAGAAAGYGLVHAAIHRGIERHGSLGVQGGAGGVLALGQCHIANGQMVLAPIKAVVTRQPQGFHGRCACPLQAVNAKGQANLQRQHQRVQWRQGLGAGRAQRGDRHGGGMHLAQLQAALQQGCQLPAHAGIVDFHAQGRAAPAQPANAAAAAQRSAHLAAVQCLPGRQMQGGARQQGCQRAVAARPPPGQRADRQHQGAQAHQQPAREPQDPAYVFAANGCGGRGGAARREIGRGRALGGRLAAHQKLNPRRKCSRSCRDCTP